MQMLVQKYKSDPQIIFLSRQLARSVGYKDYWAQAEACFEWVKTHISYVRDPHGLELVQDPVWTMKFGTGDCDDQAVLLSALCQSLGFPTRFKTVKEDASSSEFTHVYSQVLIPSRGWVAADTIVPHADFGWECNNLAGSAVWGPKGKQVNVRVIEGRPAGRIDYRGRMDLTDYYFREIPSLANDGEAMPTIVEPVERGAASLVRSPLFNFDIYKVPDARAEVPPDEKPLFLEQDLRPEAPEEPAVRSSTQATAVRMASDPIPVTPEMARVAQVPPAKPAPKPRSPAAAVGVGAAIGFLVNPLLGIATAVAMLARKD